MPTRIFLNKKCIFELFEYEFRSLAVSRRWVEATGCVSVSFARKCSQAKENKKGF